MEKIDESKPTGMTCPECGPAVPLVVRTNKGNESQFLGCSNYPECHYSRGIPEEWRLRAAGQQGLFDNLYRQEIERNVVGVGEELYVIEYCCPFCDALLPYEGASCQGCDDPHPNRTMGDYRGA